MSGRSGQWIRLDHRHATPPQFLQFDLPRKPIHSGQSPKHSGISVSTLRVSSKGQIVLPAALRRRFGIEAGTRLEVFEQADGLKLRVARPVVAADVSKMAGMVKAPSRGVPRRLQEFDAAAIASRAKRGQR